MKKPLLFLISLLAGAALSAQVQTVVTGKVSNKPNIPVILLVYNFNTATMEEEETMLSARIQPDSTFSFSTDKVIRPYTRCRLGFRNEGQEVVLSPGDTLRAEFAYGAMETSANYNGRNAGPNRYLKISQEVFNEKRKEDIFRNTPFPDSSLFRSLSEWHAAKTDSLNSYYAKNKVDTIFYQRESRRFDFEYLNDLIIAQRRDENYDRNWDKIIAPVLAQKRAYNDQFLTDLREYRDFLMDYVHYSAFLTIGNKATLSDFLDQARNMPGISRTYCSYQLIREAIDMAPNAQRKTVIRNYFLSQTGDHQLVQLLNAIHIPTASMNSHGYRQILNTAMNFMIVILVIALLLFLLSRVRIYLLKQGKQLNSMVVIRIAIYLCSFLFIITYLANDAHYGNVVRPMLRVIILLSFVAVQVFWLIPVFFKKGKYLKYSLFLLLITAAYFFVLLLMGCSELFTHRGYQWLEHGSILFIVNSWIILVPFAFLNYYVNILVRKDQGYKFLLKEKLVSAEAILHVIFLMVMLIAVFNNLYKYGRLVESLVFLIGLSIFYIHTFYLIPKYATPKKFGRYSIGCLVVFGATFLLLYAKSIISMHLSISGLGIHVPWINLFSAPDNGILMTTLVLQWIILPALIYAYVKRQLGQTSIGFKLFRNKEAELQQLRSQVNPHFLFNSLNTLYAFALKENNPKTAEYIAKLANLMRYLIDDMEKEKIPVQKEISYIRDYINLQSIRSSVTHKIEINNSIGEEETLMIAPMLMIPFVENAFKHGINPYRESELQVTFRIHDGCFQFVIENSVDKNLEAFYREKGFGIGIPNVRQRLEHIYPGKHTLSIAETGTRFIVILSVEMSNLAAQHEYQK